MNSFMRHMSLFAVILSDSSAKRQLLP